jgi:hypothetical protein
MTFNSYRRLLFLILGCVPTALYADSHGFGPFKSKQSASILTASKSPTKFDIELFAAGSPERIVLSLLESSERENTEQQGGRKYRIKRRNHTTTEQQNIVIDGLTPYMRDTKGVGGLSIGYHLSSKGRIGLHIPMGGLSPFYSIPSVCYQHTISQPIKNLSIYCQGGLVAPILYDASDSEVPPTEAGDDARSIRSTRSNRSRNSAGSGGSKTSTSNKKPGSWIRIVNFWTGSSSSHPKKPSTHSSPQRKRGNRPKQAKPKARTADKDTPDQTTAQSTSSMEYTLGGIGSLGVRYALSSHVCLEASGNVMYPFWGESPPSILPAGIVAWLHVGVYIKLI